MEVPDEEDDEESSSSSSSGSEDDETPAIEVAGGQKQEHERVFHDAVNMLLEQYEDPSFMKLKLAETVEQRHASAEAALRKEMSANPPTEQEVTDFVTDCDTMIDDMKDEEEAESKEEEEEETDK